MRRTSLVWCVFAASIAAAAGCKATAGGSVFEDDGETSSSVSGGSGGQGGASSATGDEGVGGGFIPGVGGSGAGGGSATCVTSSSVDDDGDGFSEDLGDCNDCDKNVNPGSLEVINSDPMAEAADEDCDGNVDNVVLSCDDNIALDDPDPNNGARAIDLCEFTTPQSPKWGVLSAQYVRANGTPTPATAAVGILSDFGPNVNVQGGTRLLGISSGHARTAAQPGACGNLSCFNAGAGTPPAGFPQDVPNCSGSTTINDDIGLEVKIRSPKNATGYKFNFKFYSFEYPEWVCTSFNDQFIALVSPEPMGSINGNISFDKNKNPVSVNIAFFDVCDGCPLGPDEMAETGFNTWNNAGGTAWLQTQAPIVGGDELTVRFAIWDTGDSAYDSTALIDGFQWIANGGTVQVGTAPIPDPK